MSIENHSEPDHESPIEIIDDTNDMHSGPEPSHPSAASAANTPAGDKTMAMLCHLLSFCLFILPAFGNIIGPLILWLVKREQDPFVDETGKEVLNFQISVTIYGLICFLLVFAFGLGVILGMILSVAMVVYTIIGAVKASEGVLYRYPCTIRFLK